MNVKCLRAHPAGFEVNLHTSETPRTHTHALRSDIGGVCGWTFPANQRSHNFCTAYVDNRSDAPTLRTRNTSSLLTVFVVYQHDRPC